MNQQRQDAYLKLIQQLMNCSSEDEGEILAANRDLLDAGLVQTMLRVANEQMALGKLDAANSLMNLARQLMGASGNTPLPMSPNSTFSETLITKSQLFEISSDEKDWGYILFLENILRSILKNTSNTQPIYPLLRENIEYIDNTLADILYRWGTYKLKEAHQEQAAYMAVAIGELGSLLLRFRMGDESCNKEVAIAACEVTLTYYSSSNMPILWATMQNILGSAYVERKKGNKQKNLKNAIKAFKSALKVFTYHASPQEWAIVQHNLGTAYSQIEEDKVDNLEKSIIAYKDALLVRTKEKLPIKWAITQNNLGGVYTDRILGEKSKNIENAINLLKEALDIRKRENYPFEWAQIQHNLGKAYSERIIEDRADNIEEAIVFYENALIFRTKGTSPYYWALTKNNLGVLYLDKYFICESIEDKKKSIENAIANLQDSLDIFTQKSMPFEWAMTQHNLGNAYLKKIDEEKNNFEKAINAFEAALTERSQDKAPYYWAMTQNSLGTAYLESNDLKLAIAAHQAALTIYTRNTSPSECVKVLFNLGLAYQKAEEFKNAFAAYKDSVDTIEYLREEIISGVDVKQKQAELFNRNYLGIVEVCLKLNKIKSAIEYIERSKTRNLVELLLERNSSNFFPPEVFSQLETYRDKIKKGQYKIQSGEAKDIKALSLRLQKLRQQRNELQNEFLPIGTTFNFDQFQSTLDDKTAIVEWYLTMNSIETFVITADSIERLCTSHGKYDKDVFIDWYNEYQKLYRDNQQKWKNELSSYLLELSEILQIKEIVKLIPKSCTKLILIPYRYLHLLPLHALAAGNNELLFEKFIDGVSYAPSCQILQQIQQSEFSAFQALFAIQNPKNDLQSLPYANLEVEVIQTLFSSAKVLTGEKATKENAKLAMTNSKDQQTLHYLHFACHGVFNLVNPLESNLALAGDESLTLGNLFEQRYNLNQCDLVVLSACETGLIDYKNDSDEYIGLPSGFIYAGASNVVSSLWKVNDLSTAFLMIRFYQNIQKGLTVALALNQAQFWLRNITGAELWQWIQEKSLPLNPTQKMSFRRMPANSKPFQNPFHWAAFCAVGQ
jgi:CHAT domain-containing protein